MKTQLLSILLVPSVLLASVTPTPESIERLMILTEVKGAVDKLHDEVAGVAEGLIKVALQGKVLSPTDQESVDAALKRIIAHSQAQVSWTQFRDAYVPVYQQTFTQEEIDGIVAFYQTPAGRALIQKMPLVQKDAGAIMRKRLVPIMAMLKAEAQAVAARFQPAGEPKKPSGS